MAVFDDLAQSAQFLRNAAPREFDVFRTKFQEYNSEIAVKLLTATNNLKQTQGQLQQMHVLWQMLKKIN